MSDSPWRHDLKNQLGIIVGFSGVLLSEMEAAHPWRPDVEEINKAATAALVILARAFDDAGIHRQPGDSSGGTT